MAEVKNIFDIAGRSMASQMVRLNTVASNLANAGVVTGDEKSAYRAMKPVFETKFADALKRTGVSTVDVAEIKRFCGNLNVCLCPRIQKQIKRGMCFGPL